MVRTKRLVASRCDHCRGPSPVVRVTEPSHPPPCTTPVVSVRLPEACTDARCMPPPSHTRASMANGCADGSCERKSMTPPAAFPYSAAAVPRITSTRPMVSRSSQSSGVCPSGRVSGTPSRSTRTPRTPKADRAPNPRMAMRGSCDGLARSCTCTPGTPSSKSATPLRRRAGRSSIVARAHAKGSSRGERAASRVTVTRTPCSACAPRWRTLSAAALSGRVCVCALATAGAVEWSAATASATAVLLRASRTVRLA